MANKQMAVLPAEPLEPHRERRLQPPHSIRKVPLRRRNAQMVVVRHQAVGGQLPAELSASLEQGLLERRLGPLALENRSAVVAAIDHVIQPLAALHSMLTRHDRMQHTDNTPSNPFKHFYPMTPLSSPFFSFVERRGDTRRLVAVVSTDWLY